MKVQMRKIQESQQPSGTADVGNRKSATPGFDEQTEQKLVVIAQSMQIMTDQLTQLITTAHTDDTEKNIL